MSFNDKWLERIRRCMVESLVAEVAWRELLAAAGEWKLPGGLIVLIAPHPDDEALAAGGLLAAIAEAGADVTVVAVTNGESAYRAGGDQELGRLRCGEQAASLRRLGVGEERTVRLGLPDSGVAGREVELAERLVGIVSETDGEVTLIAPWVRDFHPDHEACGRAAKVAAKLTGSKLAWWFWWSWHQRSVQEMSAQRLQRFALRPDWVQAKSEALLEHRSQLGVGAILPEELLAPARRDFEVFAWAR